MLANRLEHRRLVDDLKLGRQVRRVEDGERQRVGVVDEGVAVIERIGRWLDAGREARGRDGEREQRIAHRLDVDEHRQIVLGDRRGDEVEAELLLSMRQDDARARLHIELIVLLPVLIRDAQPEAHRDLGGVGQREVHAVQEAERHIAKVDALFGRVVEVERRRDHAPFEDERQRVGLPVQLPHEGLIELAQQIGEESHLDHLLLARAQVARGGREGEARGEERVVGREAVVAVDIAVVLEDHLVLVLRVDVHVADVERIVQPQRLRAEATPLERERQARLAAGDLAVSGHGSLTRVLRAEGDGKLAVRVGEDLALERLDCEDGVRKRERVLLDEPPLRAQRVSGHRASGVVEGDEAVSAPLLVLGSGAQSLPREVDLHVAPIVQLERCLREQRDVARLEHEQRALEAHLDVARGACETREAALARVVLDQELLGVLAAKLRLEVEGELHRPARLEGAIGRRH